MFRCPRCCKAGESQAEIQSTCVDGQTIGCPNSVAVTPGKDIVLSCRNDLCGRQFSFPADRILAHVIPLEVACMGASPCGIMVVNPVRESQKTKGK